jgi:hypothetical protein
MVAASTGIDISSHGAVGSEYAVYYAHKLDQIPFGHPMQTILDIYSLLILVSCSPEKVMKVSSREAVFMNSVSAATSSIVRGRTVAVLPDLVVKVWSIT